MKHACFLVALLAALFLCAPPSAPADDAIRSGKVVYAKTAGNYTYLQIQEGKKKVWLAASSMKVAVGDTVEYAGGDVMEKFESKAMKKTFDRIRFVARIHVVTEESPALAAGAGDRTAPAPSPSGGGHPAATSKADPKPTPAAAPPRKGEIRRAENGKTVEEIFAGAGGMKDRLVAVRGKVLKVSRNILMKNWITLSDGTGRKPNDRIVAVTTDNVAPGSTVLVRGVVKTDVNLGAGYRYKVLIDEAEVAKD